MICTGSSQKPDEERVGPVAMAFAVLMKQRNKQLSAVQKLLTILAVKGNADDMVSIYFTLKIINYEN